MLVAPTAGVTAQVNIERLRLTPVEHGFGFVAGADFTWRTGNVDHLKFDLTGRIDFDSDLVHVFAVANGDFGWVDGDAFSNEALAHLREVFRPRHAVQVEAFQQTNYDKSRALESRYLVGGGPRFRLMASDQIRAWLGTGYMLEYERLDLPEDAAHPDEGTYHRWSNYLSVRAELSESSVLQWTGYLQPRFDAFQDLRALSDVQLGLRIVGQLSLNVLFFLRYDAEPPDGVASLDTALKTGLSFEI